MLRLLRLFVGKFVTRATIKQYDDITKVPYKDREQQHNTDNLAVGMAARTYIAEHKDDLSPACINKFFG
jgi:hypothetical protein